VAGTPQWTSEGDPARGRRHERGLHQGSGGEPRERPCGVRQVLRDPERGGGLRSGPEAGKPARLGTPGASGTNPVVVEEEPRELDGGGGPEVGVDGLGAVRGRSRLRDEAGAAGHLPVEGIRRGQEAVRQRVRVSARDAGEDQGAARTDGPGGPND